MSAENLKARIVALLKMTTAAGCTEAEAMAAAEKAAALMREHGLSEADITIGQAEVRNRTKGKGARDALWWVLAGCTNTAATMRLRTGAAGAGIIFIGAAPGPEIAAYLYKVLDRALDHAVAEFRSGRFYRQRRSDANRRQAVRDFTAGMVARLGRRLIELFAETRNAEAHAMAVAARGRLFPASVEISMPKRKIAFDAAVSAGWQSGGKVPLSHGVGGGAAEALQIAGAQ